MNRRPSSTVPPFEAGELPPKKVAWLHPGQLMRTAYNVWLSTFALEYIDRRETLAALDLAPRRKDVSPDALVYPGEIVDAVVRVKSERPLWIDYLSDIGDSWEATYTMIKLLVTPDLHVSGHTAVLHPADIAVLGGDLVYPTPSRERYRQRTRAALIAARPSVNRHDPCLLAIPGNHDWYDGLTNFVREFCHGQNVGGWSVFQRRSYFAVKLAPGWWLWGIDIALDTRIDLPQQSYFLRVMTNRPKRIEEVFENGDNVILCTAKPAWLDEQSDAYSNLTYFVEKIVETPRDGVKGTVRVVLAGDMHHYSRYSNKRGDQLITAGGGGSYLMSTHHLPRTVPDLLAPAQESGVAGEAAGDEPKPSNAYTAADFPYPSRTVSRRLSFGALLLALRPANWSFALLIGIVYLFFAWLLRQGDPEVFKPETELLQVLFEIALEPSATPVFLFLVLTLVVCAIVPVASEPGSSRWLTVPWGILHGLTHLGLAIFLARFLNQSAALKFWTDRLDFTGDTVLVFSISLVVLGGLAGATLVGLYFVLSDLLWRWHSNEVFAAQSIVHYRNCLRMCIKDGELTIYPIGLRKVPMRWRVQLDRKKSEPFYEPVDEVIRPHLIEGPIRITRR